MKRQTYQGYGILNNLGTFWSHNYFDSMGEAVEYIQLFQKNYPACDLSKHRVVPVKMTMQQISE